MFSERRLDRLERLATLFVRATLRERNMMREQSDKINILIDTQTRMDGHWRNMMRELNEKTNILLDAQIRTDERYEKRFAQNEERFARNETRFARNEERFTRTDHAIERLVAAQECTDAKLQALIDAIRGKDPGGSLA